ncbi:MAG: sulfatase family protein, partial [Longimicrobiales bacterium]
TIAAVLRDNGYRTGGFVANRFYVGDESGLGRGFLHYDVDPVFSLIDFVGSSSLGRAIVNDRKWRLRLGMLQKPGRKYADDINREFLAWLGEPSEHPYFAFLNLFDAHHPYLPPAPYDSLFGPLLPGRDPSMVEGRALSPRELQAEIDAYDGGIAFQDHQLGLLLDALDARGALDNTIVIVTSDHGEEFGEHGVFTHGNSLYEPALHVPLLVWTPSWRGAPLAAARIPDWVSTRDLAATILDLAGADRGEELPGTSLARYWREPDGRTAPDTLLAAVSHARGHPASYPVSKGDMSAVLAYPLKYIRGGDGREELYDLKSDPAELHDLRSRPEYGDAIARFRQYVEPDPAGEAVARER